ncbi:F-actin-monooxygenase MICAL3 [Syngnathoides biaculeatus]|uniref:F-actin-monooxygenase MICAL3 n=1 Tax=Syngnathoides biaculeatus TaxID=300417 RepID=UPI002ADDD739|nr:F-actin-monooxygenase MICAL3 [Syngnathoides biaculeatus]
MTRSSFLRADQAGDVPVPQAGDAGRGCSLASKNNLPLETLRIAARSEGLAVNERDGPAQMRSPVYVPHALAFKRARPTKFLRERFPRTSPPRHSDGRSSCSTEVVGVLVRPEEPSGLSVAETLFRTESHFRTGWRGERLDPGNGRQLRKSARRRAKRRELKRLHEAQLIQRELQLLEEEQRRLEATGVALERSLRGEEEKGGGDGAGDGGGVAARDKTGLMQLWFQLAQRKNLLVRYESELAIFARELQLEDRQSRLQQDLRDRMTLDGKRRTGIKFLRPGLKCTFRIAGRSFSAAESVILCFPHLT